jgi:hypothetical protein
MAQRRAHKFIHLCTNQRRNNIHKLSGSQAFMSNEEDVIKDSGHYSEIVKINKSLLVNYF